MDPLHPFLGLHTTLYSTPVSRHRSSVLGDDETSIRLHTHDNSDHSYVPFNDLSDDPFLRRVDVGSANAAPMVSDAEAPPFHLPHDHQGRLEEFGSLESFTVQTPR